YGYYGSGYGNPYGYGYGYGYGGNQYGGDYGYGNGYGQYGNGYGQNGNGYGQYGQATHSRVAELQRRLAHAGYYHGSVDGVLGAQTRRAIRAYERDHGYANN
ncbi:MAG: peptidoglycan-binding domain-containing protein, partial [Candidatus Udaeobacter sp.]